MEIKHYAIFEGTPHPTLPLRVQEIVDAPLLMDGNWIPLNELRPPDWIAVMVECGPDVIQTDHYDPETGLFTHEVPPPPPPPAYPYAVLRLDNTVDMVIRPTVQPIEMQPLVVCPNNTQPGYLYDPDTGEFSPPP